MIAPPYKNISMKLCTKNKNKKQEGLSGLRCASPSGKEKQSRVIWTRRPPGGGMFHFFETVSCGSGRLQTQHLSGGCPDFLILLFLFLTPQSWNCKPAPLYILCDMGDWIHLVMHAKQLLLRAMFPGPRVALLCLFILFLVILDVFVGFETLSLSVGMLNLFKY